MKVVYTSNLKNRKQERIIFITHKEYLSILGICEWRLIRKIVFFHSYIYMKIKGIFNRLVLYIFKDKIRNSIKIVHWGFFIDKPLPHFKNIADCHLTDSYTAKRTNNHYKKNICLNLLSKDFEPISFYSEIFKKKFKWDIINVSHNARRKKLDDYLDIIRSSLDKNPNLTSLLIVQSPSNKYRKNTSSISIGFLKKYYKLFNYKERQQIVLLRISDELGIEGVSSTFIKWAMVNSRIFLFTSIKEGAAKVITEANNSNCQILMRDELKGGTKDNLDKKNVFYWKNNREAIEKIIELTNTKKEIKKLFYNKKAVKKLEDFLKKNFFISLDSKLNLYDFEFANRWLPAHLNVASKKTTNDLLNPLDLFIFFKNLSYEIYKKQ